MIRVPLLQIGVPRRFLLKGSDFRDAPSSNFARSCKDSSGPAVRCSGLLSHVLAGQMPAACGLRIDGMTASIPTLDPCQSLSHGGNTG